MRVIGDHARATTFLIADGVTPANEWRGYVLRRIMRRAMRHGRMLGLDEPFMWHAVSWVGELMAGAYPEIATERARIEEVVRQEEERFAETLDQGMRRIEDWMPARRSESAPQGAADGRFLFTLYDTYGFPRDLAEEILRDNGWAVTEETERAWTEEMDAQRQRARAGASFAAADGEGANTGLFRRLSDDIARVE